MPWRERRNSTGALGSWDWDQDPSLLQVDSGTAKLPVFFLHLSPSQLLFRLSHPEEQSVRSSGEALVFAESRFASWMYA